MKRLTLAIAAAAAVHFAAAGQTAHAQVTASSFSSGGTAISSAHGRGNTRLHSSAVATGGGYARSTMTGRGVNGGFASGRSSAISHGGVAISNGNSSANGWGARSHSDSRARTFGGFARSDSNAVARGTWANARSRATTRTFGTYGRSSSEAIDDRSPSFVPSAGYVTPQSFGGSVIGGGTSATIFQNSSPGRSIIRGRIFRGGR